MMRSTKMRRFQIYLEPGMDARLQYLSGKTGKPKAELVRDGINLLLERETLQTGDALFEIVGMAGKANLSEASERHDEYLYAMPKKKREQEKQP